jgi:peptide/nickel transport system permease protein
MSTAIAAAPRSRDSLGARLGRMRRSRILQAALQALVVAALVVVGTFLLVRMVPGDPVSAITGSRGTPEVKAALRAQLHLDRSLPTQFAYYVGDLARGDLGTSIVQHNRPVSQIVTKTLPVTLALVAGTMLFSCLIGIPLGLLAALSPRASVDAGVRGLLTVLLATPPFFIGLLLILAFALTWSILPAGGWGTSALDDVRFLVLPCIALSGYLLPLVARAIRRSAQEAAGQHWAELAAARGLSSLRITVFHILPNSLLPLITLLGYNAGALLGGAVIVEAVFGLPGIGQELMNGVSQRDYLTIQGIALVSALVVVVANLLADIVYTVVDPRTRRR